MAGQWLDEHGDYLYRFAMIQLRHHEAARDVVQDTLIAAWGSYKNFRGNASLRTWLVSILKRKITDYIRKQIRERSLLDALASDPTSAWCDKQENGAMPSEKWQADPAKLYHNQEFMTVFYTCVEQLPDQQRHIFALRELSGEDTKTICNIYGITPTNLHVIMHRARMALRQCLDCQWFRR